MYLAAIIVFLLCLIVSFIAVTGRNDSPHFWMMVGLFISLFYSCVFGLRTLDSGIDTNYYAYAFSHLSGNDYYWEPGFYWLTYFIHLFIENPKIYIYLLALINCFLIFVAAVYCSNKKYFSIPLIQILIFSSFAFFDLTTNGLRQGTGLSLGLIGAVIYIYKSKILGLLILLFATLFHTSVLIMLLCLVVSRYFVNQLQSNKVYEKIFILVLFFFVFVVIFGVDIFGIISKNLALPLFMEEYFVLRKTSNSIIFYSQVSKGSFGSLNFFGVFVAVVSMVFPIIFYIYYRSKFNKHINIVFVCYGLLLIFYCIMAYQGFSYRYNYVLSIFTPVLFHEYLETKNEVNKKSLYAIIIILSAFYSCVFVWFSKQGGGISYGI